jgi:hypothetical protein
MEGESVRDLSSLLWVKDRTLRVQFGHAIRRALLDPLLLLLHGGSRFLTRGMEADYPSKALPEIWEECDVLKSPEPERLKLFWSFFRGSPFLCRMLVKLLSWKYSHPDAVTSRDLPECLMLLELLLVMGDYVRSLALSEILTVKHSGDLRLQDIRARATLLNEDDSLLKSDLEYAYKPFGKFFCPSTFDTLAFFEREVFLCCCNYLPTSIGSIGVNSQEELWNSPTAQKVRKAILSGSFEYCNKMVCPRLRNRDLPLRSEETLSPYYKKIISQNASTSPRCYARTIELNEDPSCNLTCPSCRTGRLLGDRRFLRNFEENILPGIFDNEIVSFLVACNGDPFASRHYLSILKSLDPEKHRMQQLVLFTNGVLFTRMKWEELENLHSYHIEVRISIDAATGGIYFRLRRGGDWQALTRNLEFVSSLREEGRIFKLVFVFVVQDDNFLEMPGFVRMAKRLNVDEVVFLELQKFGEYAGNDSLYAGKAVHLTGHPNHERFRTILQDPILKDDVVSLHGCRI